MDEQLNRAPCGFLTLSKDGNILSINQSLLTILNYDLEQLNGCHINIILTTPARVFYQFYFVPLIKKEQRVEEMYITLKTSDGKEIPVLINANRFNSITECILLPMRKRSEFENELLLAKKAAEDALKEKDRVNVELQYTLQTLKEKQEELQKLYIQNEKHQLDTKQELELASNIQKTLLTEPFQHERLAMESFYKPSGELSGDMYGVYQIDEHRYGIIILDVMGHSISSALITVSLHSLFHRLIVRGFTTEIVMKELDKHLHALFHNNEDARHYCTAIYLLIDTAKREIEYVNSGHPPALWLDDDGNVYELGSTTPPIGLLHGISFNGRVFSYEKGGRLLLYTDGVTEPIEADFLQQILKENKNVSIATVKETIVETTNNRTAVFDKKDDQCLIIVDVK